MIIGTGIDMIEVQRIEKSIGKDNGFKEKIFSALEIAYCERMASSAQHFAARFAVKEAFLKAAGGGLTLGFDLKEIEVNHDAAGKPYIILSGNFKTLAEEQDWNKIHVSLSHVQAMACAVVIIEK